MCGFSWVCKQLMERCFSVANSTRPFQAQITWHHASSKCGWKSAPISLEQPPENTHPHDPHGLLGGSGILGTLALTETSVPSLPSLSHNSHSFTLLSWPQSASPCLPLPVQFSIKEFILIMKCSSTRTSSPRHVWSETMSNSENSNWDIVRSCL